MSTSNKDSTATPATEKPPEPTAGDVAKVAGKLVEVLQALPPILQLRALSATATMLGVDKEQRGTRTNANQQQRSNSNQQRGANR